MSIRRVQTERLLHDVVRSLYAEGRKPTLASIFTRVQQYFSRYPAGQPLPVPDAPMRNQISRTDDYNKVLRHLSINLDVLYEVALSQVENVVEINSVFSSHLERLERYRRRIERKIDDYLLSLYNTDGYYYSASDDFPDLDLTDITLTTAQIDTEVGAVVLPSVGAMTKKLPLEEVGTPTIRVRANGENHPHRELAPFTGAIEDGLDNILWAIEVETSQPKEIIVEVFVPLGLIDPVRLSRVEFKPYGITPVQVFMESYAPSDFEAAEHRLLREESTINPAVADTQVNYEAFGRKIQTGTNKMVFADTLRPVQTMKLTLRKTEPDYTDHSTGKIMYRYIFGAKTIAFKHQVYERSATFVSRPHFLPLEFGTELVVDAVSLVVDADVPQDTEMTYYVATSLPGEGPHEISDYRWRQIVPISSDQPGRKIVRFNGASHHVSRIVDNPRELQDLQRIPFENTGPLVDRNPNQLIVPGVDIYRIAEVDSDILGNSATLFEGVNTTRIYSRNYHEDAFSGLQYWADLINVSDSSLTLDYGRVNTGAGFFYGGDVGASAKSVYVETYLDSPMHRETFLAEFQKADQRSRLWDVKVFLNGKQLGNLPAGVNTMQLPWTFREGRNHIALIVQIPESGPVPAVYTGFVRIMGERNLLQSGEVYLDKWNHVDFFNMQYNEVGQPKTFTIYNEEIISRRRPTTNFMLKYARNTHNEPHGVVFRSDLSRSTNNPDVSPMLRSYRLRFSYGEGD